MVVRRSQDTRYPRNPWHTPQAADDAADSQADADADTHAIQDVCASQPWRADVTADGATSVDSSVVTDNLL